MKMDYKYIEMREVVKKPKTSVYAVFNKSHVDLLGYIKWHPPWRQYCFFPEEETVWNMNCLNDVVDFIKQLMDARKKE